MPMILYKLIIIAKDLWCVDAFSGHGAVTQVWREVLSEFNIMG